jgi:hypothetical protein
MGRLSRCRTSKCRRCFEYVTLNLWLGGGNNRAEDCICAWYKVVMNRLIITVAENAISSTPSMFHDHKRTLLLFEIFLMKPSDVVHKVLNSLRSELLPLLLGHGRSGVYH